MKYILCKILLYKIGILFGKLAQEFSVCPSKKKGGELIYFGKDKMVHDFVVILSESKIFKFITKNYLKYLFLKFKI